VAVVVELVRQSCADWSFFVGVTKAPPDTAPSAPSSLTSSGLPVAAKSNPNQFDSIIVENSLPNSANNSEDAWKAQRDGRDRAYRAKVLEKIKLPQWKAVRYEQCGKVWQHKCDLCGDEPEVKTFCEYYRLCPTCARIRANELRDEIISGIPKIEKADRERVARAAPVVNEANERIGRLMALLASARPRRGQTGAIKTDIRWEIDSIVRAVRRVRGIDARDAISALFRAKDALRRAGLDKRTIGAQLRKARQKLKDTLDYRWRFLTLTIKTCGRYRWAVKKFMEAFPKIWRKTLKKPGVAAVRGVEFGPKNGNFHGHTAYFGPHIPKALIAEKWLELTGSYVVDIELVEEREGGISGAVEETLKYITKFSEAEPEELEKYVDALRGVVVTQRYGLFRGLVDRKKRKIQPVAARKDHQGGWDLVYDRSLKCRVCEVGELGLQSVEADRGPPSPTSQPSTTQARRGEPA
jgi:hypothetical protein